MEDAGGADVAAVVVVAAVGDVGVVDIDAAGSGDRADGAVRAVVVSCVRVGVGLVVEAAESAGVE